jgi:hypothetical protein
MGEFEESIRMAKRRKSSGASGSKRSSLKGISTKDLAREMRSRQRKLGTLHKRRDTLLRRARVIENEISELGGELSSVSLSGGKGGRRGGGKRFKNDMSLVDALHKALKGKQLGVTEVMNAVLEGGYKTSAENFRVMVNQALLKHTDKFKKVSRGLYTAQ